MVNVAPEAVCVMLTGFFDMAVVEVRGFWVAYCGCGRGGERVISWGDDESDAPL
jgi:hypothetical protein